MEKRIPSHAIYKLFRPISGDCSFKSLSGLFPSFLPISKHKVCVQEASNSVLMVVRRGFGSPCGCSLPVFALQVFWLVSILMFVPLDQTTRYETATSYWSLSAVLSGFWLPLSSPNLVPVSGVVQQVGSFTRHIWWSSNTCWAHTATASCYQGSLEVCFCIPLFLMVALSKCSPWGPLSVLEIFWLREDRSNRH